MPASWNPVTQELTEANDSPLMSIFSHLMQSSSRPKSIRFLYATRVAGFPIKPAEILFLPRLMELAGSAAVPGTQLSLHVTGVSREDLAGVSGLPEETTTGRITDEMLEAALGNVADRAKTLCYVCGPPRMTDAIVEFLKSRRGMDERRVLCEKWW